MTDVYRQSIIKKYRENNVLPINGSLKDRIFYYPNMIVFTPQIIVVNQVFNPNGNIYMIDTSIYGLYTDHKYYGNNQHPIYEFLHSLNPKLYINAIIPFKYSNQTNGVIVLFNDNSVTKYCITREGVVSNHVNIIVLV